MSSMAEARALVQFTQTVFRTTKATRCRLQLDGVLLSSRVLGRHRGSWHIPRRTPEARASGVSLPRAEAEVREQLAV